MSAQGARGRETSLGIGYVDEPLQRGVHRIGAGRPGKAPQGTPNKLPQRSQAGSHQWISELARLLSRRDPRQAARNPPDKFAGGSRLAKDRQNGSNPPHRLRSAPIVRPPSMWFSWSPKSRPTRETSPGSAPRRGRPCTSSASSAFASTRSPLRRAGIDYWHLVEVRQHLDLAHFRHALPDARWILLSASAKKCYLDASFRPGDALIFGRESVGLSDDATRRSPGFGARNSYARAPSARSTWPMRLRSWSTRRFGRWARSRRRSWASAGSPACGPWRPVKSPEMVDRFSGGDAHGLRDGFVERGAGRGGRGAGRGRG